MVVIEPVIGRSGLRQFIGLPYRKYRGHAHWVPPLRLGEWDQFNPRKNPFLKFAEMQLFTARRDDRLVGRIAAIDDPRHNDRHHDNIAMFGFFEADSDATALLLLRRVEEWALQRGRTAVRGPLNPSLNYSAGLQIDAFDTDPFIMTPCNPPEYPRFVEHAGYSKIKDLYAWLVDLRHVPEARLTALADRLTKRSNVVVRPLDRSRLREEMERLRQVYAAAWTRNWGFVAPTEAEFLHMGMDLQRIALNDAVLLAEADGVPVGCLVAISDLNQVLKPTRGRLFPLGLLRFLMRKRLITRARLLLGGVVEEYRDRGLLLLLMHRILQAARREGYQSAEISWTLEDNVPANLSLQQNGAVHYKTYRLYERNIGDNSVA